MTMLAHPRDAADLVRRLKTVRQDSKARWGRMSAHQMICHACDALRMAAGEKQVSDATGPLQRTLIKWIALYAPLRWPPGILTRPEIDQEGSGTKPQDFSRDVAQLESLLQDVATRPPTAWPPRHPIFGPMSHRDWLRWAYLHTDHHLRQFGA
jgi:hypothetical protein